MDREKRPSWLSANVLLLSLSSLFGDISTEMLYPILPVFLTQVLGADGSIVGLVDGLAQATQNVIQGLSGSLSDRLQRAKPIALAGFLLAALAKPLIGLATLWPEVLGARLLDRVGVGTRSAPRDALIAGSVSAADRGKAFGLEGFGDNFGAFLGPLIAVLLLGILHLDMREVFYLAVIPGLLAVLVVSLVREPKATTIAKARLDASWRQLPPRYWRYLGAIALFGVGNSSNAFLILATQRAGASIENSVLIYAGFNLVASLASYPAGMLSDRLGRRNLLLAAFVVFFLSYAGFAATSSLVVIAVLFIGYGLFQGTFRAVGKALAADLVPDHLRASGIGWYTGLVGLLQLFASVVGGLLWDRVGHQATFVYGALFAAVGAVALAALVQGDRPRNPHSPV